MKFVINNDRELYPYQIIRISTVLLTSTVDGDIKSDPHFDIYLISGEVVTVRGYDTKWYRETITETRKLSITESNILTERLCSLREQMTEELADFQNKVVKFNLD